jgi:hypothetical protein
MVADAQAHVAEDRQRREEIEARLAAASRFDRTRDDEGRPTPSIASLPWSGSGAARGLLVFPHEAHARPRAREPRRHRRATRAALARAA